MPRFRLSSSLLVQDVGGDTVLFDTEEGQYYELNAMGGQMLQLLQNHGDSEQVIDAITNDYDISPEVVRRDLDALLQQLESHRLVVRA